MKDKKIYIETSISSAITMLIPFVAKFIASVLLILYCLVVKMFFAGDKYVNINRSISELSGSSIIVIGIAVITILLIYLWSEKIKKEKLINDDLIKLQCLKSYVKGFVIGSVCITIIFIVIYFVDKPEVELKQFSISFMLSIIMWIIQGFSEEVLFRGYLLNTISKNFNLKAAVIINSMLFSLMHIMNNGYSIIAFINLFVFGAIASFLTVKGSLWEAAAFHSSWNLFQGNIFGLCVSGVSKIEQMSILSSKFAKSTLLNGGEFGIENGIVTLGILLVIISLYLEYRLISRNYRCTK